MKWLVSGRYQPGLQLSSSAPWRRLPALHHEAAARRHRVGARDQRRPHSESSGRCSRCVEKKKRIQETGPQKHLQQQILELTTTTRVCSLAAARLPEAKGTGRAGRVISRQGGDVWLLGASGTCVHTNALHHFAAAKWECSEFTLIAARR